MLRFDSLLTHLGRRGTIKGLATTNTENTKDTQPLWRPNDGLPIGEVCYLHQCFLTLLLGGVELDPLVDGVTILMADCPISDQCLALRPHLFVYLSRPFSYTP